MSSARTGSSWSIRGYSGDWRVIWRRMVDELGRDAEPRRSRHHAGDRQLDDALASAGRQCARHRAASTGDVRAHAGAVLRRGRATCLLLDLARVGRRPRARGRRPSESWADRSGTGTGDRAPEPRFARLAGLRASPEPPSRRARRSVSLWLPDAGGPLARRSARVPIPEVDKIWSNGELVDWADARFHVLCHALHYGSRGLRGDPRVLDRPWRRGLAPRRAPRPDVRVGARSTTWTSRTRRTSSSRPRR